MPRHIRRAPSTLRSNCSPAFLGTMGGNATAAATTGVHADKSAVDNVWAKEKAAIEKTMLEQERQISVLCDEVAFLRLGFTRMSAFEAVGFHDGQANGSVCSAHGGARAYSRAVHRCVLGSKSRVIRVRMNGPVHGPTQLALPDLKFRESRVNSMTTDHDVYDAFIDFFYLASPPASHFDLMWKDLLVLATEFEVAALKDQCEQYVVGNVDVNQRNVVAILALGLQCDSEAVVNHAIDAHLKDPQACLLDLNGAEYKKLVQSYPHIENLISQAGRVHETWEVAAPNANWVHSLMAFRRSNNNLPLAPAACH